MCSSLTIFQRLYNGMNIFPFEQMRNGYCWRRMRNISNWQAKKEFIFRGSNKPSISVNWTSITTNLPSDHRHRWPMEIIKIGKQELQACQQHLQTSSLSNALPTVPLLRVAVSVHSHAMEKNVPGLVPAELLRHQTQDMATYPSVERTKSCQLLQGIQNKYLRGLYKQFELILQDSIPERDHKNTFSYHM